MPTTETLDQMLARHARELKAQFPLRAGEFGLTLVASGNPFDGLTLKGPFTSHDEAAQWAESCESDTWTTVSAETVAEWGPKA